MANEVRWHQMDGVEAVRRLGSNADRGLSAKEAAERLSEQGPNELRAAHRVTSWEVLSEQFKNVLIIILLVAVVLSALLGHAIEAAAIAIIAAFAVLLGFYQEFRAERALEALRKMAAPTASVLRDGREQSVPAREVVAVIVLLGWLRGQPLLEIVIFGIALAVAVVPEALPAVVTISLAIGVQRMVKRNALIRRLPAAETLGSVSVICSDKTGTLTRDEMTVRKIYMIGQLPEVSGAGYLTQGDFTLDDKKIEPKGPFIELLQAATLASDARLVRSAAGEGHADESMLNWHIEGDPTEGALVVAAAKAGLDKARLEEKFPRIGEIPFSSESKRMTTLHRAPEGTFACAKGAPETIIKTCSKALREGKVVTLEPAERESTMAVAQSLAQDALRVLAVASKPGATLEDSEREMTFLGLVGMIDPPRPEAKAAIETCERAGIRPIMITGDHPITAAAVARELGLIRSGGVITGPEIDKRSDADFGRDVETLSVYARVSPAHKLRVVTALQARGHFAAMAGDGVNDAPALKKANIGIAMGITGTDVTKEAADMTLTDDNFASIVSAVEEGRRVFENIKKYLMFLLSSNLGEIVLLAGATLLGWPLPLSAVQILYVNLATDGLPALALAVDPPEADLMRRPPRDPRMGIFTRPLLTLMAVGGLWSALVNLSMFRWALD